MAASAPSVASLERTDAAAPGGAAAVPLRFFGPGYVLAFVAVTFAGFIQAYAASAALVPRERLLPLALACGLYVLLGTLAPYAIERCQHAGERPQLQLRLLVLALLALGAYATLLSYGYTSMMLLALVSASVLYLGLTGSIAVGVLCAGLAAAGFALRSPLLPALLQAEAAFASGIAFVYVFSRIAVREQRARADVERLAAQLARANAQLAEQADHTEQLATVKERNRIAREIHDGLGHYLTVVHVQLQASELLLASEPERARAALRKAQQLTHEGLGDVRRSVSLLRGEERARRPLCEALRALAEPCRAAGLAVELHVEGEERRLCEPAELTLFRAVQEALTNAQRHARASRIEIALAYRAGDRVRLCVRDDGVGARELGGGYGLVGLRERAESLGGTVAIHSEPGQGFQLELEVPG
jgi:signal transduction histidine kinase